MIIWWDLDSCYIVLCNNGSLVWFWVKGRYKEFIHGSSLDVFSTTSRTVKVNYCNTSVVYVLPLSHGDIQVLSITIFLVYLLHIFHMWCKPSLDECGKYMYNNQMMVFEACWLYDCPSWCEPSSDDVWVILFWYWLHNSCLI